MGEIQKLRDRISELNLEMEQKTNGLKEKDKGKRKQKINALRKGYLGRIFALRKQIKKLKEQNGKE